MPYIEQYLRDDVDPKLLPLLALKSPDPGVQNYIITRLLHTWNASGHGDSRYFRYFNIVVVMGTLLCVALEFYRRVAAPYEDMKIQDNGDVYE